MDRIFIEIISRFFTYVCIILAVAFYTLIERKGLRYIQKRKGPNKVGFSGLPQPISDAVKLLTKEIACPNIANLRVFILAPIFSFRLALLVWQLYPRAFALRYYKCGVIFFLCVSSINVYGTLLAGWSSNSKYALLGALRAVAQTISYEVRIALVLLFPLFLLGTFNLSEYKEAQNRIRVAFLLLPVILIWIVTCIAETNRAPFDFAEGESEIVRGFNIEYGSVGFALIFLAEYSNILVIRLFRTVLFIGRRRNIRVLGDIAIISVVIIFRFFFIWTRASFPRFRYDLLIRLTWKRFLPVILRILIFELRLIFFIL